MARRRSTQVEQPPPPLPRRVRVGLWLTVLAPALFFLPGAQNPFSLPKAALAAVGVALCLSAPSPARMPRAVALVLGVGAAVVLLAALTSEAPLAGVFGRFPRYEGFPVLIVYAGALASWARWAPSAREVLVRALRVAVVVLLVVAVVETCGLRPLGTSGSRVGALTGNATDLGLVAVLALGPLLVAVRSRVDLAFPVAAAAVVALSGSRAALGAALMVVAWVALVAAGVRASGGTSGGTSGGASSGKSGGASSGMSAGVPVRAAGGTPVSGFPRTDVRRACAAAAAVLVLLALALPVTRDRLTGVDGLARDTVTGRQLLWQTSARLALAHPVLGVGPSAFVDEVRAEQDARWSRDVGPQNPVDSPHSLPLQLLTVGGLPLLLTGAALGVIVARRTWRRVRTDPMVAGCAASVLGGGLVLLTHVTGPATVTLMAALAGVLLTEPREADKRSGPPAPTRATTLAAIAPTRAAVPAAAWVALPVLAAAVLVPAAVAELALHRGLEQVVGGRPTDAFDLARALRPWDADLVLQEGHARAVVGDPAAAARTEDVTADTVSRLPRSTEALVDRGRALEQAQDLPGAARAFDRATALSPYDASVLLRRGVVAAELKDYGTAERLFVRATELRPRDSGPWTNLAQLYRLQGRTADEQRATAEAATRR